MVAVAAALLGATIAASPASAHAELSTSEPAAGARLDESPRALTLNFTEEVNLIAGGLRVLDSTGRPLTLGPAQARGSTVTVPLPTPLPEDGYVFTWRVLSADSHPVSGSVPFTVGDAAPATVADAAGPDATVAKAALALARWVGFLGLVLMIGPVLFVALCWSAGRTDRRVGRLVVAGTGALITGTVAGLLAQGPYVAGEPLARLTDTELLSTTLGSTFGRASAVRVIAVLALLLLVEGLRRRGSALGLGAAGVAASAVFTSYAAQGHAVAVSRYPLSVLSDTVHLAAMTTWMGGLVVLAWLLLRSSAPGDLADVLPKWSRVALISVAVLIVTGTYQSLREVGSVDALTDTPYGRLLLLKLALFAGLLGLGNLGRVWIRRRSTMTVVHAYSEDSPAGAEPDVRRLRRAVAGEAALGVVVLAVTAVLVATTPGRVATASPGQTAAVQPATTVSIGLPNGTTVDVGATADREVTILLVDAAGGPLDPEEVVVNASLAGQNVEKLPLHLSRATAGSYRADDPLPFAGAWLVTVTVQTSELESAVGTASLNVP